MQKFDSRSFSVNIRQPAFVKEPIIKKKKKEIISLKCIKDYYHYNFRLKNNKCRRINYIIVCKPKIDGRKIGVYLMRSIIVALISLVFLSACQTNAVGFRGSPAWLATAPESDVRSFFMGICLDKGYDLDSREMEVCIKSRPIPRKSTSSSSSSFGKSAESKRLDKLERERSWDKAMQRTNCIMSGGVWGGSTCF